MSTGNLIHSIDSEHTRIRRFVQGDAENFVSFMTDPASTEFMTFGEAQKSREGAMEILNTTIDSYDSKKPLMAFAVESVESAQFVGFCGLTPDDEGAVEIMYAVMPNERGKGYATEIATTLVRFAIDRLGCQRVIAPISPQHEASKAVCRKAGFVDRGIRPGSGNAELVHLFVYEELRGLE